MPSQWTLTTPPFASIPGVDPAVDWALGEGNAYFFASEDQRQWMPILVQLRNIDPSRFQAGESFLRSEDMARWKGAVRVSKLYIRADPGATPFQFCTALVTREFFALLLENEKAQQFIARITLGLPLDRESLPADAFGSPGEEKP